MSFLVTSERAEPGVPLRPAAAHPSGQERQREGRDVPEERDEGECSDGQRGAGDEQSGAEFRASTAQGAANDLSRCDRAEDPADRAGCRLGLFGEREPEDEAGDRRQRDWRAVSRPALGGSFRVRGGFLPQGAVPHPIRAPLRSRNGG
jgi:hypothetical protein